MQRQSTGNWLKLVLAVVSVWAFYLALSGVWLHILPAFQWRHHCDEIQSSIDSLREQCPPGHPEALWKNQVGWLQNAIANGCWHHTATPPQRMKWLNDIMRDDIMSSPASKELVEKLWWRIGEASPHAQKYVEKFYSTAFPSKP